MEGSAIQFQKLWQIRTTRLVFLLILAIFAVICFQNSVLTLSRSPSSLLPISKGLSLSINSVKDDPLPANSSMMIDSRSVVDNDSDGDVDLEEDYDHLDDEFELNLGDGTVLKKAKNGYLTIEKGKGDERERDGKSGDKFVFVMNDTNASVKFDESRGVYNTSISQILLPASKNASLPVSNVTIASKLPTAKNEIAMLQKYLIPDMNRLLIQNRECPRSVIPQWTSSIDQQILEVKVQIENAPIVKNDQQLYSPVFRNISMFKRSYELMEQILKVYVYKEGDRPIFHKPFLTGIYASEGWFMKQMENNKQFVADDPHKAHLFYMPFSSRTLQEVLYVKDSRSHKNLIEHLRNYVGTISSRYPFWNRTGGADHFLAGCHDWATHETGMSMKSSIRALCNADVREGFEIGKDVSLPETLVRSKDDPLRDRGGKPTRKRTTLAFFAGNMHGYLRPILLNHWENKDPDMKIFGPIPNYAAPKTRRKNKKKMRVNMYIDYMKDSKYCICPRGYEVNSPRIIEAIFYECVPVIIADNFVPPFFEVLNWEAFSVILPESDVPRLKEILVSIPRRRYQALQKGVRMVQKHFLWNKEPVKYDLFHMILHNVWFNRVFQLRV